MAEAKRSGLSEARTVEPIRWLGVGEDGELLEVGGEISD